MARCPLDVTSWGPAAWNWLHAVTFSYDPQCLSDREKMLAFIRSFIDVIPCASCRDHFRALVHPDIAQGAESHVLASSDSIRRAAVRWHNHVNARIGKRKFSYERALLRYTQPCQSRHTYTLSLFLIVAAVCAIALLKRRPA